MWGNNSIIPDPSIWGRGWPTRLACLSTIYRTSSHTERLWMRRAQQHTGTLVIATSQATPSISGGVWLAGLFIITTINRHRTYLLDVVSKGELFPRFQRSSRQFCSDKASPHPYCNPNCIYICAACSDFEITQFV